MKRYLNPVVSLLGKLAVVATLCFLQQCYALDLPLLNPEIQKACAEPMAEKDQADSAYRRCIRLVGGREMIKEIRCKDKRSAVTEQQKKLDACKAWASQKIAENYAKTKSAG